MRLRTDGVHCRESAGTGPVVLKVVPVTGSPFAGHHGPINVSLYFPAHTVGMSMKLLFNEKSERIYYKTF